VSQANHAHQPLRGIKRTPHKHPLGTILSYDLLCFLRVSRPMTAATLTTIQKEHAKLFSLSNLWSAVQCTNQVKLVCRNSTHLPDLAIDVSDLQQLICKNRRLRRVLKSTHNCKKGILPDVEAYSLFTNILQFKTRCKEPLSSISSGRT
jgi:hypothetical protein